MGDDTKQELRKMLNHVDRRDLRSFAKQKGFSVQDNYTKEEIIEILLDISVGELKSLLNNVTILELRNSEFEISHNVNKKIDDLGNNLQNQFHNELKSEMKGIGGLKILFTVIGSGLALIVAVGGVFTNDRLSNLNNELNNVEKVRIELTNNLTETLQQSQKLFGAYRTYIINRWREDLYEVMEDFSSGLPDIELLNKIQQNSKPINEMWQLSKTDSTDTSNDKQILAILAQFYSGLDIFEQIKEGKHKKNILIDKLNQATEIWRDIDIPKITESDIDKKFIYKTNAYRYNILGVIKLYHYMHVAETETLLKQAIEYFNKSIEYNQTFPRPYNNRAVAYYKQYALHKSKFSIEQLKKQNNINKLQVFLKKGMDSLRDSITYDQSPRSRSILYNNIANYLQIEAKLLYDIDNLIDAKQKIVQALDNMRFARGQAQTHPVVFFSQAEIMCFNLLLNIDKVTSYSVTTKKEKLLQILNYIEMAERKGLESAKGMKTIEDFLSENKLIQHLNILQINYKDSLSEILGI
jgi:hypothetical protein